MDCTVHYGLGYDIQHRDNMPVAEAFRKIRDHAFAGYAFVNVYYNGRLVYTDESMAGYVYICENCPYKH